MNDHLLAVPRRRATRVAQVFAFLPLLLGAVPGCGSDVRPVDSSPDTRGGAAAAGAATNGGGGASGSQASPAGGGGAASNGGSAPNAGSSGSAGSPTGGGGSATGGSGAGGNAGNAGDGGNGGMSQEPKKPIRVWMAGDSTMQECSSACPCGWGSRFDELFDADVTVVNRAAGGRSIGTWLYEGAVSGNKDASGECTLSSNTYAPRWNEMLDATSGMKKGDYLFVQFGINDSTSDCPRHVGQEKFQSYLAIMAKAALERGATPVLVTPVSAISCSGSSAVGTRGAFVTSTQTAAMTASVPLVDLHQLSVDRYNALGFCPNDSNYGAGKLGAFFCQDHTHFESAGAQDIAKLVAKALVDAQIPLAGYLLPGAK